VTDAGSIEQGTAGPSLRALVRGGAKVLAEAGVPSPDHDAEELAAHVLGLPRSDLVRQPDVPAGFAREYAELIERRRQREPLQRILGYAFFRHVRVAVNDAHGSGAFVPRPETEVVAQIAVDEAAGLVAEGRVPLVVDLCCGTGVIGLSVDVEVPGTRVVAVDLSETAVALTRRNHGACGSSTMRVEQADAGAPDTLADLDGLVDVVVANPPYIPPDTEPLEPEVRDHDPDLALYGGGPDGLDVPRSVVTTAARLLRDGGLFVMEHADAQGAAVRGIVESRGDFDDVRTLADLTGRDRMVVARRRARQHAAARA
jgi:release factor glutamine methyltransferase